MSEASLAAETLSPPDVAAGGGKFSGTLLALRKLFLGRKYEATIQDIQTATGCARRTVERAYAGQSVSDETMLRFLTAAKLGGAVLEDALRRVPLARRAQVAASLRDAADLIRMEAEHEELALKLAAKRAAVE